MFDRLYKVVLKNSALPDKVLVINGDSSKPSLGVDFSVSINQSYVSTQGRLTIYGLTEEHIGLLSAIRRYEYSKNAAKQTTATLLVGWRDCDTGRESPLTVIMHGTIIEATPGPLPDRSLSMTLFKSALKTAMAEKSEVIFASPEKAVPSDNNGVKFREWLEAAAKGIQVGSDYSIDIEDNFETFPKVENASYPKDLEEFKNVCRSKGCVVEETVVSVKMNADEDSSEDQDKEMITTVLHVSGDKIPTDKSLIQEVSQETGMIGIPRSILMGAVVDVVLKDIIHPGTFVNLQTKKFPKMSSDDKLYTNGGIYLVMSTTISGQFYGDVWKQTLTLNRGGSILKQ